MTTPISINPAVTTAPNSMPRSASDLLRQITDPFGVYCVLEIEGNWARNASIFHAFPVMPETLEVAQRYLQTVTPTQGGIFVDEYGRAPSPITLYGTFGRSPRFSVALGQEAILKNLERFEPLASRVGSSDLSIGQDLPVTGYKLMKLLAEMVELSHRVDPVTGKPPVVRFYNFAFGSFYEVVLSGFRAQMSVERNGLWLYELQMVMLRRINPSSIDSLDGFSRPETAEASFRRSQELFRRRQRESRLGAGFDIGGAVTRWLPDSARRVLNLPSRSGAESESSANSRLRTLTQRTFDFVERSRRTTSTVSSWVTGTRGLDIVAYGTGVLDRVLGMDPGTTGSFADTLRRWPDTVNAVQSVISQASLRIPQELREEIEQAVALTGTVTSYADQYLLEANASQPALPYLQAAITESEERDGVVTLAAAAADLEEALDSVLTTLYVHGLADTPSQSVSSVFTVFPDDEGTPPAQSYMITQGDTLASIAYSFYGDENAWPQVLTTLGDDFVGIVPTEPLDAHIGTVLNLRGLSSNESSLVPDVWDVPAGARSLGKDLPDEMTTTTRQDGTKELIVLTPYETLMQGLLHRLQTSQGALPDRPEFGSRIPSVLGQDFGALTAPMNGAKAEEALRNDPRLSSVSSVLAVQDMDALTVEFEATAANAGSLGNVNLSFSRQSP